MEFWSEFEIKSELFDCSEMSYGHQKPRNSQRTHSKTDEIAYSPNSGFENIELEKLNQPLGAKNGGLFQEFESFSQIALEEKNESIKVNECESLIGYDYNSENENGDYQIVNENELEEDRYITHNQTTFFAQEEKQQKLKKATRSQIKKQNWRLTSDELKTHNYINTLESNFLKYKAQNQW